MSLALVLSLALSQAPVEAVVAPMEVKALAAEAKPMPNPPGPELPPGAILVRDTNKSAVGVGTQVPGTSMQVNTGTPWWQKLTLGGFARVGLFYTFPFQDEQLVGGHGGFRLADFRLGLDFHPIEKFTVYTSIELAAPLVDPSDPLAGRRVVDLRDAYVQYDLASLFKIRVGQFRPPYYAEMLQSDGAVPFVSRSVLASGLTPPDGFGPRTGLAPDRQLGVQFSSDRIGGETLGFKYAVGVFNGNGQNQLFNDNNSVQPVARVELDVFKKITLGVNGYYNQRTDGARPNRLSTNQVAYGADLSANVMGFTALAAFLGKQSTYSYAGLPPDSSMGALGQVRYFHEPTGLEAAGRFAWYEPSAAQSDDQAIEITAMVGWRPFSLPFRVLLQYSHREEEQRASYPNDSVDMMIHAVW